MALFNKKFANFFGLVDEEEYEEEVPVTSYNSAVRSLPKNSNTELQQAVNDSGRETRFSAGIERAVKESHQRQTDRAQQMQQESPKVVAMNGGSRSSGGKRSMGISKNVGKISIIEPRVYSEAMTIAKRILAGESVLVNFDLLDESQARRVVDFLTGAVYAEDGDIQRVGDEIFLCTPAEVEIDSTVAQSLAESNFFD